MKSKELTWDEYTLKKIISIFLAATIAASTVGGISVYAAENNTGYLYGDANIDGVISVSDATLIQQAAVGLAALTEIQKQLADVDGDGSVSVSDVTCVQKYLAQHTAGCGKTGKEFAAQTQHRLLKSVNEI